MPLKTEYWGPLPIYLRKRVVSVKIGGIPPDIEEIWMVAAVVTGMKKEARVV